jgi:hypothetical protein
MVNDGFYFRLKNSFQLLINQKAIEVPENKKRKKKQNRNPFISVIIISICKSVSFSEQAFYNFTSWEGQTPPPVYTNFTGKASLKYPF